MHKPAIYLALLHHPVYNKNGEVVTTAVTNVDVHDITRTARTYGIKGVFFVTPIEQQRVLVSEIIRHWTEGAGAKHNPDRAEAFSRAAVVETLEGVVEAIAAREGKPPVKLVTSARRLANTTSFQDCLSQWKRGVEVPQLVLFGTGWGLVEEVTQGAEVRLAPVNPAGWVIGEEKPYNHLSVRSAVATVLDRLLGDRDEQEG